MIGGNRMAGLSFSDKCDVVRPGSPPAPGLVPHLLDLSPQSSRRCSLISLRFDRRYGAETATRG